MTLSSRLITGDNRDVLKALQDESVQCVITSPPYWGLRDYGVEGQIGLEPSPQEYVAQMVEVFREVKRVLRADGTLWLNMGDSYASSGVRGDTRSGFNDRYFGTNNGDGKQGATADVVPPNRIPNGLKPKDLIGVPWRLAFALQDDGWWLRSDIIWAKPNPMPESVTDRPTKAHEYIFLMTKSARYYYDEAAVRVPSPESTLARMAQNVAAQDGSARANAGAKTNGNMKAVGDGSYANLRDVWTVATHPFLQAHFATFPPKLIEPCVKAGTKEGDVILDPFAGAGTTGLVATRMNRQFIGIELNPEYAEMARQRIVNDAPLFMTGAISDF